MTTQHQLDMANTTAFGEPSKVSAQSDDAPQRLQRRAVLEPFYGEAELGTIDGFPIDFLLAVWLVQEARLDIVSLDDFYIVFCARYKALLRVVLLVLDGVLNTEDRGRAKDAPEVRDLRVDLLEVLDRISAKTEDVASTG